MDYVYKTNEGAILKNDKERVEKFNYETLSLSKTGLTSFPFSANCCAGEVSKEIALQAHYLKFPHPRNPEETIELVIPMPSNWESAIK